MTDSTLATAAPREWAEDATTNPLKFACHAAESACSAQPDCRGVIQTVIVTVNGWIHDTCWPCARRIVDWLDPAPTIATKESAMHSTTLRHEPGNGYVWTCTCGEKSEVGRQHLLAEQDAQDHKRDAA